MAGPVGLDYTAVYRTAEILEIDMDAVTLRKIRVLEAEYLNQFYGTDSSDCKARNIDACAMCRKTCNNRLNG